MRVVVITAEQAVIVDALERPPTVLLSQASGIGQSTGPKWRRRMRMMLSDPIRMATPASTHRGHAHRGLICMANEWTVRHRVGQSRIVQQR